MVIQTTTATEADRQQYALQKAEKKTSLDKIRAYAEMDEVKKRFINLLGDRDGRAYVESVVIAVANSESLQECTPKSIMISAMRAASLKLSLDPILQQAYLVAYGKEATLIPDYHGIVQLSVNTNYYEIAPNVSEVWEGEIVEVDRFSGKVTITGEKTSDKEIGWCAYFKAKNGIERWLYMTNEQLDAHAEMYNPGGYGSKKSPWNAHGGRDRAKMRRKTCLRIFVKRWGNFSPQVQNIIMRDEPIDADAFDLPDDSNIPVSDKHEIKNSEAANMATLGFGNPDPVKDSTWKDWEDLKARAQAQKIDVTDVQRGASTESDLIVYMAEVTIYVRDAEAQEKAA